jgi:hypothetical protein
MADNLAETPRRYTSYHSDKTFSILEDVRGFISRGLGNSFEYNGLQYWFGRLYLDQFKTGNLWRLKSNRMKMFLTTDADPDDQKSTLNATFDGDKFDAFIETFEIEGKTVRWVLEHQKCWKYIFSSEHFEKVLTGYGFEFVYRGVLCNVTSAGMMPIRNAPGRYLRIASGVLYDVTQYAPVVPGAEYWYNRIGEVDNAKTPIIWMGPFVTDGELLDKTGFNGKTLREIFDTEYDDGEVCCGMFTG